MHVAADLEATPRLPGGRARLLSQFERGSSIGELARQLGHRTDLIHAAIALAKLERAAQLPAPMRRVAGQRQQRSANDPRRKP